jgi:hypothetical protein
VSVARTRQGGGRRSSGRVAESPCSKSKSQLQENANGELSGAFEMQWLTGCGGGKSRVWGEEEAEPKNLELQVKKVKYSRRAEHKSPVSLKRKPSGCLPSSCNQTEYSALC